MKIVLYEYSEEWISLFKKEKHLLQEALGSKTSIIEHIGSTSVKGLAAKPIIDIMIGLFDFSEADSLIVEIKALGYEYIPEYEDVMPYRRFFKKIMDGKVTHHIHMVSEGSEFWRRHLLFRDYLRMNSDIANQYAALKKDLAKREWNDTNEYAEAKSEFIRKIEKIAALKC
ncbi:MAG: GrpB family protein [Bacteroidota bacterium]|nr:GrpB family protein [Bacteroidota bacterium]MDP4190444.1 GrpB family protein [Bacteroidota bacterium]MDP4194182.1 GrpB family protein [Bacteroidota bacterium]